MRYWRVDGTQRERQPKGGFTTRKQAEKWFSSQSKAVEAGTIQEDRVRVKDAVEASLARNKVRLRPASYVAFNESLARLKKGSETSGLTK